MSDEKLKAHEELGGVMIGLDRVLADIAHERKRAVVVKGHTRAEDDRGLPGRLALAATCYAFSAARTLRDMPLRMGVDPEGEGKLIWEHWPTTTGNFRPKDARSDLVRAAQFIVAEIERIDRKAAIYDDVRGVTSETQRAFISIPLDDAGGDAELQALGTVIAALTSFDYGEPARKLTFDEKRSIAAYLARRFGATP